MVDMSQHERLGGPGKSIIAHCQGSQSQLVLMGAQPWRQCIRLQHAGELEFWLRGPLFQEHKAQVNNVNNIYTFRA